MTDIVLYSTEQGDVSVKVLVDAQTLWLTQLQLADLFAVQKAAISKHLKNIFATGELDENSVVSNLETTASDGKKYKMKYYNLDAIIAVGYRANSKQAINKANEVYQDFNRTKKIESDFDKTIKRLKDN